MKAWTRSWRVIVPVMIVSLLSLSGCQFYVLSLTNAGDSDGPMWFSAPGNRTQVDAIISTVPVTIEIPGVDPGSVQVRIETGSQTRSASITDRFTAAGDTLSATLISSDFLPGVTYLVAEADAVLGSEHVVRRIALSWEPNIDVTNAGRCETLGQARCLLPFPSNAYTVEDPATDTGLRVNFDVTSMPSNKDSVHIDPTEWNRNDGFSPGAEILVEVPGLDLSRTDEPQIDALGRALLPDSPVMVIDADSGEKVPVFAELNASGTPGPIPLLIIRPVVNLLEGHRYIVGLRNLRRSDGSLIEPDREFRVQRDIVPTFIPEIEQRRAPMQEMISKLNTAGMLRQDMYLAWDFTVASERSITERSLSIRDQTFDPLGADGTLGFTVSSVQENVSADILRRVTGTFEVPNYLTGDGAPGTSFNYDDPSDPDALPSTNGVFNAGFICNIPRSSVDGEGNAYPGRSLVYGHGLLGASTQVNSFGKLANSFNYTMCATDWIGMSTSDVPNVVDVLGDYSTFKTLPDRLQQGMLNFQVLGRLLNSPEGFMTDPAFEVGNDMGSPFRPHSLVFNGNSQGGVMGGATTALSNEWSRAALGVPGMNYSTLLTRSVDYDAFGAIGNIAYPDAFAQIFGQALVQMLWDRGESNGYANHMTDDPLPGTQAHTVLLIEAFGDHQVANITTENMARTVGAATHMPNMLPGRSWDTTPMWGIERIGSFPYTGSALVEWDFDTPAPPKTNTVPRAGTDPHGLGGGEPRLGLQVAYFFEGVFIDVCGGGPCVSSVR